MSAQENLSVEDIVEIHTMTDDQIVVAWAAQCKISQEAVEKLVSEGFASMEAIHLLDREDMKRSKLRMGQQKLILAAVQRLNSTD